MVPLYNVSDATPETSKRERRRQVLRGPTYRATLRRAGRGGGIGRSRRERCNDLRRQAIWQARLDHPPWSGDSPSSIIGDVTITDSSMIGRRSRRMPDGAVPPSGSSQWPRLREASIPAASVAAGVQIASASWQTIRTHAVVGSHRWYAITARTATMAFLCAAVASTQPFVTTPMPQVRGYVIGILRGRLMARQNANLRWCPFSSPTAAASLPLARQHFKQVFRRASPSAPRLRWLSRIP